MSSSDSGDIFGSDSESCDQIRLQGTATNLHDDAHYKQGYVDGVSSFDNHVIQENCDSSYRLGSVLGYRVGKLVGKIQFYLKDDEATKKQFLEKLNVNSILQAKNFSDDYSDFLSESVFESIERELDAIISSRNR